MQINNSLELSLYQSASIVRYNRFVKQKKKQHILSVSVSVYNVFLIIKNQCLLTCYDVETTSSVVSLFAANSSGTQICTHVK